MGSYLSIVNDTNETWHCKIGPDTAALKISGLVIGSIGTLATVLGTAGAAAPLAASLAANGVVSVFGVSTSALATATTGAAAAASYVSVVGGVSGFGLSVAKTVSENLEKQGFQKIPPGKSYRWGKMSLSLWQQGTCVKGTAKGSTVTYEKLYMRPIFSGATDKSNRDHTIQFWVNKWGTEKETIEGNAGSGRALEEASGTDSVAYERFIELPGNQTTRD